jgi:hypothetical protein
MDSLRKVQETAINNKVYGQGHISGYYIEVDKRKRGKVVKDLMVAGMIADRGDDTYTTTDVAYNSLGGAKPDLVDLYHVNRLNDYDVQNLANHRSPPGVYFCDLSLEERKWVADHIQDYTLALSSSYDTPRKWVPFALGTAQSISDSLYVTDAALDAALADKVRNWRIAQSYERNLAWALEHLLGLPEDDAKHFVIQSEDHHPLWGADNVTRLGPEASKWATEMREAMAETMTRLAEVAKQLNRLAAVEQAVGKIGGWEKFAADYRAKVEQAIDKAEDKDKSKDAVNADSANNASV